MYIDQKRDFMGNTRIYMYLARKTEVSVRVMHISRHGD